MANGEAWPPRQSRGGGYTATLHSLKAWVGIGKPCLGSALSFGFAASVAAHQALLSSSAPADHLFLPTDNLPDLGEVAKTEVSEPRRVLSLLPAPLLPPRPRCSSQDSFLLSLGWEYNHLFTSQASWRSGWRRRTWLPETHLISFVLAWDWNKQTFRKGQDLVSPGQEDAGDFKKAMHSHLCESWNQQTLWYWFPVADCTNNFYDLPLLNSRLFCHRFTWSIKLVKLLSLTDCSTWELLILQATWE